ncbi:Eco29kI family restriction endonuclease [Streptomyces sp. NPDC050856]|uniref:Eco29kI family restriction endonuclease n=1 Tax=Streptomyces sp. NPDC050856 TaxID=3154939 RepID=UPI0033DA7797
MRQSMDGCGEFHDHFRLSITKALGDQLAEALERLESAELSERNLAALEERPGVYQLYHKGSLVYVGKADQRHKGLPGRLRNHLRKLSGRRNIDPADISFRCLYVDEDFSALAPEQLLINHHRSRGGIPWNNSGFGSKDPGRRRDRTVLKKDHFDVQYPINLEARLHGLPVGEVDLRSYLRSLKTALPYNFRYAEPVDPGDTTLRVPDGEPTADEALRVASAALPASWQITALLNYVIMYEEDQHYKSASRYYRAGDVIDQEPEKSAAPLTSEDVEDTE